MNPLRAAADRIKQASSREDEVYQAGYEAGRAQAIAELTPQIEKIAAASVAAVEDRMEKRSHAASALRGQVAVHSMVLNLSRYKQSMANGVCWKCEEQPANPRSAYLLCPNCESQT